MPHSITPQGQGANRNAAAYRWSVRLPNFSLSWDEGAYFDLWMAVHFASGVAGGFSNIYLGLSTQGVLVVASLLMMLWELFEFSAGIREATSNRVLDIAVGLGGVLLALWISSRMTARASVIAFVMTLTVALIGTVMGWRAYRQRKRATEGTG
jgi:hypothetical protein